MMQKGQGEQGSLNMVDAGEAAGIPKDAKPPSSSPQEHHPKKREGLYAALAQCQDVLLRCVASCAIVCSACYTHSVTLLAPFCVIVIDVMSMSASVIERA